MRNEVGVMWVFWRDGVLESIFGYCRFLRYFIRGISVVGFRFYVVVDVSFDCGKVLII